MLFKFGRVLFAIFWVIVICISKILMKDFQKNSILTKDQFEYVHNLLSSLIIYILPVILSVLNGYCCIKQNISRKNCFIQSMLLSFSGFLFLWILFVLSESHILSEHLIYAICGGCIFIIISGVICGGMAIFFYEILARMKNM